MRIEEAINLLSKEAQEEIKSCKSIEEISNVFKKNNIDIDIKDIELLNKK